MLADSTAAVTALAFASARNDLLAYGGAEGDMWFVGLPPGAPPVTIKVRCGRGLLDLRAGHPLGDWHGSRVHCKLDQSTKSSQAGHRDEWT